MAKKKNKLKIKLRDDENYCISSKQSTVLILSDTVNDNVHVDLLLPDEDDMQGREYCPSINLAVALTTRMKEDPSFTIRQMEWFTNRVKEQRSGVIVN